MRAVVHTRYGSPDLLDVREIERPIPGRPRGPRPGARRLGPCGRVAHDHRGAAGPPPDGRRAARTKEHVPGTDLAGVVEAVGLGVARFRPGDEVFGKTVGANSWRNGGAYAEFATADEDRLEPKPGNVTFEQAAASPDSGTIALQGIRDEGRVRPGHRVLINGAGGGVGTFAVQIARALGAAGVTGVDIPTSTSCCARSARIAQIDPAAEDFTRSDESYDLILDIPGNRSFAEVKRALKPEGTYVLIGHDAYGRADRPWIGSIGRFAKLTAMAPFEKQLPGLRAGDRPGGPAPGRGRDARGRAGRARDRPDVLTRGGRRRDPLPGDRGGEGQAGPHDRSVTTPIVV